MSYWHAPASRAGMIGRSSHADGVANNGPVLFIEHANSSNWTAVHIGQFAAAAIMLAGLFARLFALNSQTETARWAGRFGAVSSVATLALYGALQAVDWVALKQAVNAWATAPEGERPLASRAHYEGSIGTLPSG